MTDAFVGDPQPAGAWASGGVVPQLGLFEVPTKPESGSVACTSGAIGDPAARGGHTPGPLDTDATTLVSPPPDGTTAGCNLTVSGIPTTLNSPQLTRIFERFGKVLSAMVMLDTHTGRSRGFGFVYFDTAAAAQLAIAAFSGAKPAELEAALQPEYVLRPPTPQPPPQAAASPVGGLADDDDEHGAPRRSDRVRVFESVVPPGIAEATAVLILNWPNALNNDDAHDVLRPFARIQTIVFGDVSPLRKHPVRALRVGFSSPSEARSIVSNLHGVRELILRGDVFPLPQPLITKFDVKPAKPAPKPAKPAAEAPAKNAAPSSRGTQGARGGRGGARGAAHSSAPHAALPPAMGRYDGGAPYPHYALPAPPHMAQQPQVVHMVGTGPYGMPPPHAVPYQHQHMMQHVHPPPPPPTQVVYVTHPGSYHQLPPQQPWYPPQPPGQPPWPR